MTRRIGTFARNWHPAGIAFVAVLVTGAVLLVVELGELFGFAPAMPFLLIFLCVALAATVGGLAGGLTSGLLVSAYIGLGGVYGFGPETLIDDPWHALESLCIVMLAALMLGRFSEQQRRYRAMVNEQTGTLYRSLVERAPEAICVLDHGTGRIVDCNPPALTMFGLSMDEISRYAIAELSPPTQPDGRPSTQAARAFLDRAIHEGAVTFEWMHRDARGRDFPCEVSLSLVPDQAGTLIRGSVRDITERKREEQLRDGEHRVLEAIAQNRPLDGTLDLLARLVEEVLPGSIASILLLERNGASVRHGAGPSLSETFQRAINGLSIGPAAGSCGTAMYRDETVISEDLREDPRWEPYLALAEPEGLRSCWSTPVHDSARRVVGSFAVYYREPHRPSEMELAISGRLRNLAGIAVERARAELELVHSEALYRATFENAAVGIAHLDPEGRYIKANRQLCKLLGFEEEELQRMTFEDVTHPEEVNRDVSARERLLNGEIDSYHVEKRYLRKDGEAVWANLSVGAVRDSAGVLERLVVVAEDVSAAHRLSEALSYQARHDALTGLINRAEFDNRLREFLDEVRADDEQGAVCYMDLDQFKLVNDTAGHVAGDEMLRQLAPVLRHCIRSSDVLARLGGDEFGILLRGCGIDDAMQVAEKIRTAIEEFQFAWEKHSFRLGVSIGVVPLENHTFATTTEVLQAADTVCYTAKDEGRNRVVTWNEEDLELYRRHGEMQWVPRLNRALEGGHLKLHAQPIVSLDDRSSRTDWFELLVRMRDGEGEVAPGAFLPAAERYGLSHKLDRYVVEMALDWLETFATSAKAPRLSINLSGATVGEASFRGFLIERLDGAGDLARSLCFEITETAAISDLTNATKLIEQVRARQCLFGLDDFGSGLSSFAYLKALPVDFLKIDGTFVRDVADDPVDRAIVQSISEVARVMGMRTVAEFVESKRIVKVLRDIGVDYAQGFWTGKPKPVESLLGSGSFAKPSTAVR